MQNVNAQTITVTIPATHVLISVEEKELLENTARDALLDGKWWSMKDLEASTGFKYLWLRDNILYPFRSELDVDNGGPVHYPSSKAGKWTMNAKRMAEFLEENFAEIMTTTA